MGGWGKLHPIFFNFLQSSKHDNCCVFQRLAQVAQQQVRYRTSLPFNTVFLFVPQQEAWIIERFGKFQQVLSPVSEESVVLKLNKELSSFGSVN